MVVHVKGNQVNKIVQREEKERTEFDDYRNVKSGDYYRLEDVCVTKYPRKPWWCYGLKTDKTICVVEVIGTEGRFTSVTYTGPDARRAFEGDFRKCSRARSSKNAQVFAVDIGTAPSLLLWHDKSLVPISHFKRNFGWVGGIYVHNLRRKLNCSERELWADSAQGVICRGPEGPKSYSLENYWEVETEKLPLTIEMFQEDVFIRFVASQKSKQADDMFLSMMWWTADVDALDMPESIDQPTIVSTVTATPIAIANSLWTSGQGFVEEDVLEKGLTSGETSRLHFWSLHKDGQSRLSPESYLDLGLPIELRFWHGVIDSWKTNNYKQIHQYQQVRGFDPMTTDFAQHLGYNGHIFQPIHHSDCFMEFNQEHSAALDADGSVTSDSSECLLDTMDHQLAEDPKSLTINQVQTKSREDEPTVSLDHVTNKHQRRDVGYEGTERNNLEPDLCHEDDATNDHDHDLAMDGRNPRLVQPLPTRSRTFPYPVNSHPPILLNYSHPPQGHQLQLHPYYHNNQPPYPYPSRPANPVLRDVSFTSRGVNMPFPTTYNLSPFHLQSRGWSGLSRNEAVASCSDTPPHLHAYNSARIVNSANDLTMNTLNSNFTATNEPGYDPGAAQNAGWLGTSQIEPSAPVNMFHNGLPYSPTPYSIAAVTHPSNLSVPVDFTYPSHSAAPTSDVHDPIYPPPFPPYNGGSFASQQHCSIPVVHHNPSRNSHSFSPVGVAHYPSKSTVRAQTHLPYSAHTPQGRPSMLPSNVGDPHISRQPWNMPANSSQRYTYEPSMQTTQPNFWNKTSGEFGEGNRVLGWQ
ncbi:hypothetical protein PQX77_012351 [Marasmius sp. AFHP31]|nr:hypothetical protein PQX77_012351 [Marasmius sp. AFHP31]